VLPASSQEHGTGRAPLSPSGDDERQSSARLQIGASRYTRAINSASDAEPACEDSARRGTKAKKSRMARYTHIAKYSIFARGGVPQFHSWCALKFGSLVRLWRCLDVHHHMRVGQGQFLKGLQELGYSGDARELFKVLNRDQTGTLLFYHFAPEAALSVAELLDWSRENFGSLAALGLGSIIDQRSFITRQQFTSIFTKKGFTNQRALRHTFDLIDKDGAGSAVKAEVALLDKWEFPEWLTAKPDERAAEICKSKLVTKCQGNPLAAWRQLDRNGNMRVAWNEFRQACRKLLTQEDCEVLPAVWRALDEDLSGWLSLRDFDVGTYNNLLRLVNWAHESTGCFTAVFRKLTPSGKKDAQDYRITQSEWNRVLKACGLGDQILATLYSGLDKDRTGSIPIHDIRFLDQWRATSDLKETEAWAAFTGRQKAAKRKGSRSPRVSDRRTLSSFRGSTRNSSFLKESNNTPPVGARP